MARIADSPASPLVLHRRLHNDDAPVSPWYWIVPNYRMAPIAAIAVLCNVPSKFVPELMGWGEADPTYGNLVVTALGGEFKELAYAIVMMFFFLSLWLRLRSMPHAAAMPANAASVSTHSQARSRC